MKWARPAYGLLLIPILASCSGTPYRQGERLYNLYCASCHMENGRGLLNLYPPVNSEDFLVGDKPFACIVRDGIEGPLRIGAIQYDFPMPGIPQLNSVEIANIYNYITAQWHPGLPSISPKVVEAQWRSCTK